MGVIEIPKRVCSFRFTEETIKKLEMICSFHQQFVNQAFTNSKLEPSKINGAMIVESLIEDRYQEMMEKNMFK
jgi:hypothetical protein